MLLDEHETSLEQFEELTIQKKKLQTIFWIIAGILGFVGGILIMVMEQMDSIGNSRKKLSLWFIALGMSSIFGMLAYFGFKTRISLNGRYGQKELLRIPVYETYFWIAIFVYFVVLIYLLWEDLFL